MKNIIRDYGTKLGYPTELSGTWPAAVYILGSNFTACLPNMATLHFLRASSRISEWKIKCQLGRPNRKKRCHGEMAQQDEALWDLLQHTAVGWKNFWQFPAGLMKWSSLHNMFPFCDKTKALFQSRSPLVVITTKSLAITKSLSPFSHSFADMLPSTLLFATRVPPHWRPWIWAPTNMIHDLPTTMVSKMKRP